MAEKKERSVLERMVCLLSRRNYSKMELRQKFSDREKYTRPQVEQAIAYLEQKGYINDLRYAADCVRVWQGRHYGPIKIRNKLREKGIRAEQITAVMTDAAEEMESGNPTLDLAVDLLMERSKRLLSEQDFQKRKAKALRLLASRGFPGSIAFQAFDEWKKQSAADCDRQFEQD